ncbi:NTP transferase domain-containing protein [Phreatobacter cathodiphilus]|uniref:4-diphosphocytidyl-2C-methyl-D-erythritol kinase n=1 Tax=Phreatobacter cathodiphilus TaxID=1868589 RepID=A0A2S0NB43_9HYPH|nr:molybdopterin-binding/glycosyltransferase family 2 protein [Phreatobacter cathodiphilus]AVO45389.1 4-diphosphocytidyl-2C-methyl-D-erythritol kinase [Phreatobacter cathodiphilus]
MRFGPLAVEQALGGVVAHAVRRPGLLMKKGSVIGAAEIAALKAAGIATITVALAEPGDIGEDEAAGRIAAAVAGEGLRIDPPFTGRANLFAAEAGVLMVDREGIDRINRIDEAITLATLPAFAAVEAGEMVATVKIIPYAVAGDRVAEAIAAGPLVRVAPFVRRRVAVVSTLLPGLADKVVEKTLRVTADRLAPAGAAIVAERRVPHEAAALTAAIGEVAGGADLVLVFGASAIADRRDVIPAALEAAGGQVDHLGMPVDPGNLLMVGALGSVPVLGAPGCARSPKENGFDWVLMRLLAGLPVTKHDVTGMGVGGLLMEIVSRPQPREGEIAAPPAPRLAAVVLAAGRSTRMGGPNKLLAEIGGRPLVRHAVEAALGAGLAEVLVVTGHQEAAVRAALADLPVRFAHNPDFPEGLSTSLKAGIAALGEEIDGVVVLLGDMPAISSGLVGRLAAAFAPGEGRHVVVPVAGGRRGNPVLWGRRFFAELMKVTGDQGGRAVLAGAPEAVAEVPAETDDVHLDLDTPEALAAAGGRPAP